MAICNVKLEFVDAALSHRMPGCEIAQLGKGCGCLAGVDGFDAQTDAFLEIGSQARSYEGRGSVEQHNVAPRAGQAGEHVVDCEKMQPEQERAGLLAAEDLIQDERPYALR